MVKSLVIIGPAWPLRGGLAAFDEQLANTFNEKGVATRIETFSLQYPSFLFPGTSQYTKDPAPIGINIKESINSINPFNWFKIGRKIKKERPDIIIVRYWIPFLAPCLGTICRIIKSNKHTKIIALVDNMIPHEKRWGDKLLTGYFAKYMDGFLTMSKKVLEDVKLFSNKPMVLSAHPIFNHFGEPISKEKARQIIGINKEEKIILFFGFIRQYKGLDLLLNAMASSTIKSLNIKLLIVGEFYEDAKPYHDLIKKLNLEPSIIMYSQFIPDAEVKNYVCAADFIIQPYKNATQSGVTPLAYHFEKPMLVTNVGALADSVPDGKVGVVLEPFADYIAKGIEILYNNGEAFYITNIIEEKKKYSWSQMTDNFISLAQKL
jgi:glycosyltransferase involved in cell wall biosynthesis